MFRIKGYSLIHSIYLIFSLLVTKVYSSKIRLLRVPFYFRIIGKINFGKNLTTGRFLRIDVHKGGALIFGNNIEINDNCQIACSEKIFIGNDVLIASKVFITDHDHDFSYKGIPREWPLKSKEVIIGNCCWSGNNVSILKGVHLGEGVIVGANSVVTKSFPSKSIIAGIPAKLIKFKEI